MANLFVAYVIWMFGGLFGLHHLYLGRLYHAFVWYSTFGGVCGMGWTRDMWRLPHYVRSSNADKNYQKDHLHRMSRNPKPGSSVVRFMGMFVMGYLLCAVLVGCLPNNEVDAKGFSLYRKCAMILILIGSSIGVYLVANIGELQCSWKHPVIGSLISLPWLIADPSNLTVAPLISTLVTWWFGLRWKPLEPLSKDRKSKCGKFMILTIVYTGLLCYGLYHNASVNLNGEKIPLRDAIKNFFASPAWHRTKESMSRLFKAFMKDGWDHAFHDASDVFDFSGEIKAFSVIGLSKDASESEITKKCRKLMAQHHPDRFKTQSEKDEAQEKFIEIQDACSTLSKYRSRGGRSKSSS